MFKITPLLFYGWREEQIQGNQTSGTKFINDVQSKGVSVVISSKKKRLKIHLELT